MTMHEVVATRPDVIVTDVTIFHPQLRDVLQPAGEKGKVLFIHRSAVECADFNTMKAPTQFCALDFSAVCLTTGAGLMAAGGEHSELDIRPLWPTPGPQSAAASTSASSVAGEQTSTFSSQMQSDVLPSRGGAAPATPLRPAPRWHLRTPTGGSINNSICIQPAPQTSIDTALGGVLLANGELRRSAKAEQLGTEAETRHREKRRKEDKGAPARTATAPNSNALGALAWRRDEPWGRPGEAVPEDGDVSASSGATTSEVTTIARPAQNTAGRPAGTPDSVKKSSASKTASPVRLLISNNDRSVKAFRLRPPARQRNANGAPQNERIECGLPGLSRTQTLKFPTCVNHSSFSPDGRHVVSVGDTSEVFLFSVHPKTGELSKIATYTASDDASFSTTWSPDSMQFAVASQDGIISIWDVRSSKKIAALQTSQASDAGAARVVKWSPRGDILAFSEHQNYIHIVDTINFECIQRIRIPSLNVLSGQSSTSGQSAERCVDEPDRSESGMDLDNHNAILEAALSSHVLGVDGIGSNNSDGSVNLIEDFLGSTSPSRFASAYRGERSSAVPLPRPWMGGQLLRRSAMNTHMSRSTLDRTLLGEWATNRRNGTVSGLGEWTMDGSTARSHSNGDSTTATTSATTSSRTYASSSAPTTEIDWQSEVRASTPPASLSVDAILSTLGERPERSAAGWSSLGGSGITASRLLRRRGDSNLVDISGLTWDTEGDYLYVSTCELIARYKVVDLRRSFGQACLR